MNFANGLHSEITRAEYDAIPRENFSKLKRMARSPLHYRAGFHRDSDSMKLGRAAHLAVLEPARFDAEVAIWTGDRRSGKAWDAFKEEHAGKELLTEEEAAQTQRIAQAVRFCPSAQKYLGAGTPETTILWECGGTQCKGRLDFDGATALVDLKSTTDASIAGFGRQAHNFNYLAQAAFYADGYAAATGERKPFVLIAVEKESPFACQVYRVTDEQIERGRRQYLEWMDRLAYCRKQDFWPGYADGEMDLSLPRWAEQEAL